MEEFDVDAQMKRLTTQKPSTSGHKAPHTGVTVWACNNIRSVGQIVVVDGKMDDMKYMEVLGDNLLDSV